MSREQDNDHLKVLVDDVVVNFLDPVYWKVVGQEDINLRWANNHPHESEVNSCFHQARCSDEVVWVDVTQPRKNVEAYRGHHDTADGQKVQEESGLEPPGELGIDHEHPRDIKAVVFNVTSQTLIFSLVFRLQVKVFAVSLEILHID